MPTRSTAADCGRIILLNGTSSSGKSTLAKALQAAMPNPWLVIGMDAFVRGGADG